MLRMILKESQYWNCRRSPKLIYEGESISNHPVPFPISRDGHAFPACFNTCFIRGYKIARLSSHSSISPGRVEQSVGHLTRKSGVLGSIPGQATYFRFSFRFFKKGSCQLLAKVCARSTG